MRLGLFSRAYRVARRRPGHIRARASVQDSENERKRIWSRKTAAVLDVALRNGAVLNAEVLQKFAQLPPHKDDIIPLLPLLESQALTNHHSGTSKPRNNIALADLALGNSGTSNSRSYRQESGAVVVDLGEFAMQTGVLSQLSPRFTTKWLFELRDSNVFRAIEVWKALRRSGVAYTQSSHFTALGASLYLSANKPERASQLAITLPVISSRLFRDLIATNFRLRRFKDTQYWIDRWQAPAPEDLRWLHHLIRTGSPMLESPTAEISTVLERTERNSDSDSGSIFSGVELRLPKLSEQVLIPGRTTKVGKRLQNLVSRVNGVIIVTDALENKDVYKAWIDAMANPTQQQLQRLVIAAAQHCAAAEGLLYTPDYSRENGDASTRKTEIKLTSDWMAILRLVDSKTATAVLQLLRLPSRAAAAAISRTRSDEELASLLSVIKPDSLYSAECLSALASRKPKVLLELIVPPELLESQLTEHQLTSLWSAEPPPEVQQWLLPLTLKVPGSSRLLRAALLTLAKQNRRESAEQLLKNYLEHGYKLDERLYRRTSEPRLPPPPRTDPNSGTRPDASTVDRVLTELFKQ